MKSWVILRPSPGFRQLGNPDDSGHAHILFSPTDRRPQLILYHTQEFPESGYLFDVHKRSWIHWMDASRRVENAVGYIRSEYPDTPDWNAWKNKFLEASIYGGGVDFEMLAPERVGVEITYRPSSWTGVEAANVVTCHFVKIKCPPPTRLKPELNVMEIALPTAQQVCLLILPALPVE